jgi:hypothetical protein
LPTKGILEGALNVLSFFTALEITYCKLIDIKIDFCFPVTPLDTPAMKLLAVLLAALVSKPLLNVGEGMVV